MPLSTTRSRFLSIWISIHSRGAFVGRPFDDHQERQVRFAAFPKGMEVSVSFLRMFETTHFVASSIMPRSGDLDQILGHRMKPSTVMLFIGRSKGDGRLIRRVSSSRQDLIHTLPAGTSESNGPCTYSNSALPTRTF